MYRRLTCPAILISLFIIAVTCPACVSKKDDTLIIGLPNAPLSLASWRIRDGASTVIGNQTHRSLLKIDPITGLVKPNAASSFSVSIKKKQLMFKLRSDLKFHDGSPLDCLTTKKSFERLVKNSETASLKFPINTKFQCQDDKTLIIQLDRMHSLILEQLASPAASIAKNNGLIGLGPFRLVRQSKQQIELERVYKKNPQTLIFKIAPAADLVEQFNLGKVHDILYLGLLSSPESLSVKNCKQISGLSPTSFWINLNTRSWGLDKRSIRKAVHSLLTDAVQSLNLFEKEVPSHSLIPFGISGRRAIASSNDRASLLAVVFNHAKKYGHLHLTVRDVQFREYDWQQLTQYVDPMQQWIDIEILDSRTFFERYYTTTLSVFLIGANASRNDPFEVLSFFRKSDPVNPSGIKVDVVDRLQDLASKEIDRNTYLRLAHNAEEWVINEGYAVPLFSKRFRGCTSPYLTGYSLGPLGPLSIEYENIKF